jgi:hypothetical protein
VWEGPAWEDPRGKGPRGRTCVGTGLRPIQRSKAPQRTANPDRSRLNSFAPTKCHPEAVESLAKPRTPNEGSMHPRRHRHNTLNRSPAFAWLHRARTRSDLVCVAVNWQLACLLPRAITRS